LNVGEEAARACAAYLTKFWKDGQLPMRYDWGLSCMPLGGYNTYTTTQSPINKQRQLLNTLLMTTDVLPLVRDCLPGFRAMERHMVRWLKARFGTRVKLFEAHGLRQGPLTKSSTSFAIHRDDEVYGFIKYSVIVKLTSDEAGEAASSMRVVGAPRHFKYGPTAGDSGCFRAGLFHESVEPRSAREHFKIAFFFRRRRKQGKASPGV
jgi:hypothetical protein